MKDQPQRYDSFLLRLWRLPGPTGLTWRIMLENPHSGERYSFASLETLTNFLKTRFDNPDVSSLED